MMARRRFGVVVSGRCGAVLALALAAHTTACGNSGDGELFGGGGAQATGGTGGTTSVGGLNINPGGGDDPGQGAGGESEHAPPGTLPAGFTKADVGGYKLGDPIEDGNDGTGGGGPTSDGKACGTVILAVIRDFKSDHPDFEKVIADETGIVKDTLGADRKPVYAHDGPSATVSGAESFDQWYRNVKGVNMPFVLKVFFQPVDGTTSFQSNAFFPLDGQGFGNETDHNFHFTTEIHTQFRYKGHEVFNFSGDDDVWIFINNHLLVDLGGVHPARSASVDMDAKAEEAGLEVGKVYPFDMFQAERHTTASNFRADTNLEFVDCGTIVPEVPK